MIFSSNNIWEFKLYNTGNNKIEKERVGNIVVNLYKRSSCREFGRTCFNQKLITCKLIVSHNDLSSAVATGYVKLLN